MANSGFRSISIYRAGGLGDTLLLIPALRALHPAFPGANLRLFGSVESCRLLQSAGLVDGCFDADDPSLSGLASGSASGDVFATLQAPDAVVVYTRNTRTAESALSRIGVPFVVADPVPPASRHAAEQALACLEPLGVDTSWPGSSSVAPIRLQSSPNGILRSLAAGLVLLHPGSGASWKCPPASLFDAVVARLTERGFRVSMVEGPADARQVGQMAGRGHVVRGLQLSQAAGLIASSRAFIGNDSGLTHLAGLLGMPTVAIFGPTHPDSWGPLGPRVSVVRTCHEPVKSSIRVCDDPDCLEAVTPEMVMEAFDAVVGN